MRQAAGHRPHPHRERRFPNEVPRLEPEAKLFMEPDHIAGEIPEESIPSRHIGDMDH